MLKFNKEYFLDPYYFFLKDRGNTFSVYYSVSNTLSEARKMDEKIDFDKKDFSKVGDTIGRLVKSKKVKKTSEITKKLKDIKDKSKEEMAEFIDADGTLSTSKVPIINNRLSPKRTLDQTLVATMQTNNPVTRGYRVYYGESEKTKGNIIKELSPKDTEKLSNIPKKKSQITSMIEDSDLTKRSKEKLINIIKSIDSNDLPFELINVTKSKDGIIKYKGKRYDLSDDMLSFVRKMVEKVNISEVNYSDAYGYEETKDMDGKETFNYLKKELGMDPIEAANRTKEFGKDYTGERKKKAPKKLRKDPNFIDRMTLAEMRRQKLIKMVEDILSKKKEDGEIQRKENKVSKILIKNIQSIKKIAEREGISINQLIKALKSE